MPTAEKHPNAMVRKQKSKNHCQARAWQWSWPHLLASLPPRGKSTAVPVHLGFRHHHGNLLRQAGAPAVPATKTRPIGEPRPERFPATCPYQTIKSAIGNFGARASESPICSTVSGSHQTISGWSSSPGRFVDGACPTGGSCPAKCCLRKAAIDNPAPPANVRPSRRPVEKAAGRFHRNAHWSFDTGVTR